MSAGDASAPGLHCPISGCLRWTLLPPWRPRALARRPPAARGFPAPPEFRCPRFHLKFHERRFVLPARLFLCIFLPPLEGAGDPPGHLGDGAGHAAARGARCQSDYVRHDASAPGQVRVAGLLRGPGRRNVRPRPMPVKPHRCQQRVPVATAKGDVRRNAPVARFRDAARQQVAHAADPAGPGSCGIL